LGTAGPPVLKNKLYSPEAPGRVVSKDPEEAQEEVLGESFQRPRNNLFKDPCLTGLLAQFYYVLFLSKNPSDFAPYSGRR
jgi:hypothetical protein